MDYSLPGSPIHGIFQARILEWVAISFSSYLLLDNKLPPKQETKRLMVSVDQDIKSSLSDNRSDFAVDHLVLSMCRVFSCIVGRGCLIWPVCSLGKTLLGQIFPLLQVFLDFLLLHCSPLQWKGLFGVLVLKGLVGLHRTIQFQLLLNYCSGHRLRLLWYWMVCLGNEQRSFCCFWDCIQVLHFRLFCWL